MKKILQGGFLLFFFYLLANSFFVSGSSARDTANENAALQAILEAENIIASAYVTVLKSEQQGADVRDLLGKLNAALELLNQGNIYYRLGNLTGAIYFANLSSQVATNVKIEARKLGDEVLAEKDRIFWITITATALYMGAVAFGSFCGWHIFKRLYYERVLRMKPEVNSDES